MDNKSWNIYVGTATRTHPGMVTVGKTRSDSPDDRMKDKLGSQTAKENVNYVIHEFRKGLSHGDEVVHNLMIKHGAIRQYGEWFSNITVDTAIKCLNYAQLQHNSLRTLTFKPLIEQQVIIDKTLQCFRDGETTLLHDVTPRTGKTFITCWISQEMNWQKVLIITAKPAAGDAWYQAAYKHVDFEGFEIVLIEDAHLNPNARFVFASKQWLDYDSTTRIAYANELDFDAIVWDESHYAKNTDNAQAILDGIERTHTLFLSGTAEEDLKNEVFRPEQIIRYSLLQQQMDKQERRKLGLGRDIEMPTPNIHVHRYLKDFYDKEGRLNTSKLCAVKNGQFIYKETLLKLLDYWTGLNHTKYPMDAPYFGNPLFESLNNFMMFFDDLKIAKKFQELMKEHDGFNSFEFVDLTNGDTSGGTKAIDKITESFNKNPRNIIISCDKAGTGTTIPTLDCVIMFKNLNSAPTYTQYGLRCQSPLKGKDNCYIVDLNYRRAIEMVYNMAYMESTYGNLDLYNKDNDFTTYIPIKVIDEDGSITSITGMEIIESVEPSCTQLSLKNNWKKDDLINFSLLDLAEPIVRNYTLDGKRFSIPGLRTKTGKGKIDEFLNQPNEDFYKLVTEAGLIVTSDPSNDTLEFEEVIPVEIPDDLPEKEKKQRHEKANNNLKRKYQKLVNKIKTMNGQIPLYLFVADDHVKDFSQILRPDIFFATVGTQPESYNSLITLGVLKEKAIYQNVNQFFYYKDKYPNILSIYYPKLSLPIEYVLTTDKPVNVLLFCEKLDGTVQVRNTCPNAKIYYIIDNEYDDPAQKYVIARSAEVAEAIGVTFEEAKKITFHYGVGSPIFFDNNQPIYLNVFNKARQLDIEVMMCFMPSSILTTKPRVAAITKEWYRDFQESTEISEIKYWQRGSDIIPGGTTTPIILATFTRGHKGGFTFTNMETEYTTEHENLIGFQIPQDDNIQIIEKVTELVKVYGSISSGILPATLYKIPSNTDKYTVFPNDENTVKLYCSDNKIYYTSYDIINYSSAQMRKIGEEALGKFRVIVPKTMSSRKNKYRLSNRKLLQPGDLYTETFKCIFASDTMEEAQNFLSYTNTRLFEYMVFHKCNRRKDISMSGFDWIPALDYSYPWSDEDLAKLARLNEFERELILNDMY